MKKTILFLLPTLLLLGTYTKNEAVMTPTDHIDIHVELNNQ